MIAVEETQICGRVKGLQRSGSDVHKYLAISKYYQIPLCEIQITANAK